MHRGYLKTAALMGAFSVAMGAFAAHTLKGLVSDYALGIFKTAVEYQFYHVFALLIVSVLFKDFPGKWLIWAGRLFITGIVLFSGSLYVLAFIKGAVLPGLNWVGAITPFGGLCFILGWVFIFISIFRGGKKISISHT